MTSIINGNHQVNGENKRIPIKMKQLQKNAAIEKLSSIFEFILVL